MSSPASRAAAGTPPQLNPPCISKDVWQERTGQAGCNNVGYAVQRTRLSARAKARAVPGRAARGAVRIAAAKRWRRMRRCTSSSRSACVVNGRLRHTRARALRRTPPCVVAANALRHLVELSDRDASTRRAQCRLPARPRCRSSSVRAPHAHPGRVPHPRRPPRGLCAGAADRPSRPGI